MIRRGGERQVSDEQTLKNATNVQKAKAKLSPIYKYKALSSILADIHPVVIRSLMGQVKSGERLNVVGDRVSPVTPCTSTTIMVSRRYSTFFSIPSPTLSRTAMS